MDLEDRFDKAFQNGNVSELKKKGYISGKAVGEMVWKMEEISRVVLNEKSLK